MEPRILRPLAESTSAEHFPGMISAAQCRAARGLLGWSQTNLAERAGVGRSTVMQLELRQPIADESGDKIKRAFELAGVRPLRADEWGGEGVRFVK